MDTVYVDADKDKSENGTLPGCYVQTKGQVGILGTKDVMDEPFSQVNMTRKTIEAFGGQNQPLQSILVNSPAVRVQGTTLHNDFSIRGIKGNGTSSYLNGIPGLMTQFFAPTYFIGDIQVISGPNTGITGIPSTYETSAAGGIVNFVSKKAGETPLTRFKQTFSGRGSFGEYLDVGRRFGENNEWGIRVNTEILNGESAIQNNDMEAQGIYVNVDHRDEKSKTNILAGYSHKNIEGGARWFNLGSAVTKIPTAPDASKDYGFDGIAKEAWGEIFAINHEQKINDDWKWFANLGWNHNKLKRNIIGASSNFVIINDAGDVNTPLMSTQTMTKNYYAQFGFNGKVKTGVIDHDITVAADKAWYSTAGAKNNYKGLMGNAVGNIYTGIFADNVWFPTIETTLSKKKRYWGLSFADTMTYKKAQILLGVHKHEAIIKSYSPAQSYKTDAVCPTYGFIYQPNDHVSLYANHTENFDAGDIVTNTSSKTYQNVGDILNPAKVKQNEIGIKYENNGLVTSLGLFQIKQANNLDVQRADGLYLLQDGEQEYKGIELSVNGRIADKWNFMGGLMYLDAKQNKTKGGTADGLRVDGAAEWNAVAAFEYEANDQFSFVARALYTGTAPNSNEKFKVPSYMTYDLGINYKTHWNKVPVTISAMCYNVTDKDYWIAYKNSLLLSQPRTFVLSAAFDF